ncbi:MAG: magnesium/cobalt transporter CorA [SAR324 cluster bacterium]|nr:magnesium/cobalt transporter CorA [SAR324 cluster bacterium]
MDQSQKNTESTPQGSLLMTVMSFNANVFHERELYEADLSNMDLWYLPISQESGGQSMTWIHVHQTHNSQFMEQFGRVFEIHPMLMEDITSDDQRPKTELYEETLLVILKEINYDDQTHEIQTPQISFILGADFLVSFPQVSGITFNPIIERLRKNTGKVRKMGIDYLLYALIDAVVDYYFVVLGRIYGKVNRIEETVLSSPSAEVLEEIHNLRQEIIWLRGIILPSIDAMRALQKRDTLLIRESTLIYFRDIYDHMSQAMEMFVSIRDILTDMVDTYISSMNYKMNEVMKTLTMLSTIFIPLTFIASVYGMNFEHMPELHWNLGYPLVILVMVWLMLLMLGYFKRKKWF